MKRLIIILLSTALITVLPIEGFSQTDPNTQEFGIAAGGFSNFPANQHYLTDYVSMFYAAPYIRTGQHEFFAGVLYPLATKGIYFSSDNISPRPGFIAGYKFYVFNIYGRENMFIHYSFEYIRFKGDYDINFSGNNQTYHWTETDMYINNVIGLGYNLFFDMDRRFGLYYTLDYLVSQTGYRLVSQGYNNKSWFTQYVWNNLSNNFGVFFKLTPLKKKTKKPVGQ
jgi:hypothetical protein